MIEWQEQQKIISLFEFRTRGATMRHIPHPSGSSVSLLPALRLFVVMFLLISFAESCAPLPRVGGVINEELPEQENPTIYGVRGPLSAEHSKAILAKLKREAGDTDILKRHLALEEAVAGEPLVAGNKVTLLENGPATYASMFQAIDHATNSVNLECFTVEADEIGQEFAKHLILKQHQGVQVNIIYDSFGSLRTPASFFKALKDNGIMVTEFNPINLLAQKEGLDLNHRDHRKIMVVDGYTGFIGGVNISEVYSSRFFDREEEEETKTKQTVAWRDTEIRIQGPAVARLQEMFMDTWKDQKGQPLNPRDYFPEQKKVGHDVVRILDRTANSPLSLIYITLLSAIRNAETSVHLTSAYFAPDHQFLEELETAARRGVDVRLILPGITDIPSVRYAGRSHYSDLLEAGVKIYERRNALLHAKTGTIDGVWSTVGSTNLDWRSFVYDDEANAVVIGVDFAGEMEAMFQSDIQQSEFISKEEWDKRSLSERIKEMFFRVWERLL
jgi:cardiolipin synthase